MKNVKSQITFFLISKKKKRFADEIKVFFEEALKCHNGKSFTNVSNILNFVDLPCLTNEQKDFCETELGEKELLYALESMPNNKTPGNDGLSKQFYEAFWKELKDLLLKSFYHAKTYKKFSTSQRQVVIKLLEKKDRDKRFIMNWTPISLLNNNLNIFSSKTKICSYVSYNLAENYQCSK